jgi:flagellar hook-associated protein 3 FlgL
MTMERVTTSTGARLMLANLQANYSKLTLLQTQIASGKQLQKPSDGPARVITALDYRAQLARGEQLDRNTDDAQGWLGNADSTVSTAVDYMQSARTLALQGLNGSADPGAREAIAAQIRALRSGLLQLANSKYQDRPIFAGTVDATTAAYSATGVYQGNAGAVNRTIAPGVTVQVNVPGPQVFGTPNAAPYSGDVFQALDQLANDVQAGNTAGATAGLTALDFSRTRMQQALGGVGAKEKRIEDVKSRNADITLENRTALSDVEDIDLPKTLIDLQSQQVAYQSALAVTAKVIQPSLLDFLR